MTEQLISQTIIPGDIRLLRDLYKRVAELAHDPVMEERRQSWLKLASLERTRPMILAELGGVLDETVPLSSLRCQEEWARDLERGLRTLIFQAEQVGDDFVIEPWINIRWDIDMGDYGVEIKETWADNAGKLASRKWDSPIKDLDRDLDKLRFRDFLRDVYKEEYPDSPDNLTRLLQNMNLATDDGRLNLAGVLLFAEQPEWIVPQFVVKAIRYPGNKIHATDYLDTEDFSGPLPKLFEGALAFVMRNLHKVQAGRGVNAPGTPEISEAVFEELLVNALMHRDYLVSAPIRLFIFDNRIEIISPGHLPNNLTVEKIRAGNSNIRNPILVSYVAKGLLPYHGLGSGIKRALEKWPAIDFADDHDGCLFTATVYRKPVEELDVADKGALKVQIKGQPAPIKASLSVLQVQLLDLIRSNPTVSYDELAEMTQKDRTTVMRNIGKLKDAGILQRVGSKKTGHWEVS